VTWPNAAIILGVMVIVIILIGGALSTFLELRKAKLVSGQEDSLRRLVSRYEQLAENTLDTQQRIAADVAELRTRTAAIEQILRTVE
jgi:flagellar basal body-associated protein FliL